jgi:hypothetical protein
LAATNALAAFGFERELLACTSTLVEIRAGITIVISRDTRQKAATEPMISALVTSAQGQVTPFGNRSVNGSSGREATDPDLVVCVRFPNVAIISRQSASGQFETCGARRRSLLRK